MFVTHTAFLKIIIVVLIFVVAS